MKMKFRLGAAAAALATMAIAAPAWAQQDGRGVYAGVRAGVASVNNVDLTYFDVGGTFGGSGTTDTARTHADVRSAFTIGGTLGYDFGMVRADVQVDYSRNRIRSLTIDSVNDDPVTVSDEDGAEICDYLELDDCSVSGNTISGGNIKVRQLSALANLWLDIPVGGIVTPYVGGGAGIGGYEVDGEGKARFAWQLGAGVAVNVSPSVAITADFRHRQINGARIVDSDDNSFGTIVGKVKTNSLTAGLRFLF